MVVATDLRGSRGRSFGIKTSAVDRASSLKSWLILPALLLSLLALSGCDPIITIAGADFPSWLLCLLVGALITAAVRPLLSISRLELHVGPLIIFYPSLIAMLSMIVWVTFFNRT